MFKKRRGTLTIALIVIAILAVASIYYWYHAKLESERRTVRFAYQDRIADAAAIIAVKKGFFEEEGLILKTSVFTSGPACSEAIVSGAADIGTMGDTTGIIAISNFPVKIVASHGGGEHRHRIIARNGSGINSISDLKGKRVAIKFGTSTYGGFLLFAEKNNLSLDEMTLIDMKPIDMPAAIAAGSVDAVVASEPSPSLIAVSYTHLTLPTKA